MRLFRHARATADANGNGNGNGHGSADPAAERRCMVDQQLRARGIRDERVLQAFGEVPRELFVEPENTRYAYADMPLPIGEGQTISQPYVVALMVEALEVGPTANVLEVGAGSGYAAAILSRVAQRVVALERHASLAGQSAERMRQLGYDNVLVQAADGTLGWPDAAPFDAILVSAGGSDVPEALLDQLALGGHMVIPIGGRWGQELLRITKSADGRVAMESLGPVVFVPLVAGQPAPGQPLPDGPPPPDE